MTEQGPLSNRKLGERYLLGALLGQGGFGAVYQAQHLLLNRPQAIKILLEQHFTNPKSRERFVREAQVLAKLDHPNIVHVDDFGVEGSRAYLVMPYIGGGTLQSVLKGQREPLGLGVTWRYLEQICGALDYAHARSVAHLDLKPLNLLMHEDGRVLLSDFGLAHLMEQGAVEGGTSLSLGTPSYMAPELFDGQPEQRSDIYALGVILYQMLTGRLPFEASMPRAMMMKVLTELPPPLRAARPELPPNLDDVLGKALAKEKALRYQSAGELLADFKAALAGRQMQASSGGFSLANAPTHVSQPPQGSTVWTASPPGAPLTETLRAANPPGVALPPTILASHPPVAPPWQPAPGSEPFAPDVPPMAYGMPGAALPASSAPRKAKVWTLDFIVLFCGVFAAGVGLVVWRVAVYDSFRVIFFSVVTNAALAFICLVGLFFATSRLILAGLGLQIPLIILTTLFPIFQDSLYDTRYEGSVITMRVPLPGYYLFVLAIAVVGTLSLLCISYGIARWKTAADLPLLLLQISLSVGLGFLGPLPSGSCPARPGPSGFLYSCSGQAAGDSGLC